MNKVESLNDAERVVLNILRTTGNERSFSEELIFTKSLLSKAKTEIDLKKVIKKGYKGNIYFGEPSVNKKVVDALNSYPIINFGTYYHKWQDGTCDNDSWVNWYIIETKALYNETAMIREAKIIIANILGEDELEEDRINSPYDSTGQIFSEEMNFVRVGKNRVLAKKYFGRDV